MSIDHYCAPTLGATPYVAVPPTTSQPLHRLKAVRRQQNLSRHVVASRLGITVEEVQRQENEDCDIPLSTLYAWERALRVPAAELLVGADEKEPCSVAMRSLLLRLMKTVQMISERTKQNSIRWMSETMASQLIEVMPELANVGAWTVGDKPRGPRDLGAAARRGLADGLFVDGVRCESASFAASYSGVDY
jgi:transcriptional regulator with XRE-family HTH domain